MEHRRIADAHCHLHEFSDDEVKDIALLGIDVIAVSDDYYSSLRTLTLSERYSWVIPAVGIHPWSITLDSINEFNELVELVNKLKHRIKILGEIGLDKKFKSETFAYQLQIFKLFIELGEELKAILNIHAAGAWKEVLDLMIKSDISTAIIHWYTGPIELLKDLESRGFYISINPAVSIQEKHREIVAKASLDMMLVESDAPYRYRGMMLHPRNVYDVMKYIAQIKNLSYEEVYEAVAKNYEKLRNLIGLNM